MKFKKLFELLSFIIIKSSKLSIKKKDSQIWKDNKIICFHTILRRKTVISKNLFKRCSGFLLYDSKGILLPSTIYIDHKKHTDKIEGKESRELLSEDYYYW